MKTSALVTAIVLSALPTLGYPVNDVALEAREPMKVKSGTYIPPERRPSYVKDSAFAEFKSKREPYRVASIHTSVHSLKPGETVDSWQDPPSRREPLVLLPGMEPIRMPTINGRPIAKSVRDEGGE